MASLLRCLAVVLPVVVTGVIAYWLKRVYKQNFEYSRVLIWFCLSSATYVVYRFVKWYLFIRRLTIMTSDLNNPPKHWLFGNLIDHPGVCEEQLNWLSRYANKYGKIFRLFHGLEPQLYITHPSVAKELLRANQPKPLVIPGYAAFLPWLGKGLLFQDGAQWLRNRRLLTPAFHFDMLKNYLKVFNSCSSVLTERLSNAVSGVSVDSFTLTDPFTLDTLLRCAFSYTSDIQLKGFDHPVLRLTSEGLDIVLKRCFNPVYYPDLIFWLSPLGWKLRSNTKQFNDFSRAVIETRQEEIKKEVNNSINQKNHDFLSILLKARDEEGKGLTNDEILAEVKMFLFAGFDTTSSALSWTLYQLAAEPEHQEKCRAEVDDILKDRESDDLTWNDVMSLDYVTRCIKEAMRINTTVPVNSRYTERELVLDGHVIPKDILINISIFHLHMNPDVWGDPEVYRPDRFLPDEVSKRDSYAFVPFSAGSRNCIGQNFALNELRVAVSKIVRNFKIGVDISRPPKRMPKAVMRAENGLWLTFTPIQRD